MKYFGLKKNQEKLVKHVEYLLECRHYELENKFIQILEIMYKYEYFEAVLRLININVRKLFIKSNIVVDSELKKILEEDAVHLMHDYYKNNIAQKLISYIKNNISPHLVMVLNNIYKNEDIESKFNNTLILTNIDHQKIGEFIRNGETDFFTSLYRLDQEIIKDKTTINKEKIALSFHYKSPASIKNTLLKILNDENIKDVIEEIIIDYSHIFSESQLSIMKEIFKIDKNLEDTVFNRKRDYSMDSNLEQVCLALFYAFDEAGATWEDAKRDDISNIFSFITGYAKSSIDKTISKFIPYKHSDSLASEDYSQKKVNIRTKRIVIEKLENILKIDT